MFVLAKDEGRKKGRKEGRKKERKEFYETTNVIHIGKYWCV